MSAPPVNVRLLLPDDSVVPFELLYAGRDEDGVHVWYAAPTSMLVPPGALVLVEELPPMTVIVLPTATA